jgi:hypothetical protein
MLTSFDVGRTFRTPILKLGVNWIAAISKENVIWTEGCIVAAACRLALVAQLTPFGLARQNGSQRREEHCADSQECRAQMPFPSFPL